MTFVTAIPSTLMTFLVLHLTCASAIRLLLNHCILIFIKHQILLNIMLVVLIRCHKPGIRRGVPARIPCILLPITAVCISRWAIVIPGCILALGYIFSLTCSGHATYRLLELLDILQLVVCFAFFAILLLKLVLLIIIFLRHSFYIRVRIFIIIVVIISTSAIVVYLLRSCPLTIVLSQCLNFTITDILAISTGLLNGIFSCRMVVIRSFSR